LVGASGDDDNGSDSGSAYVFRFDGNSWVEEQKLVASDGALRDGFGCSVAISGDVALAGASGDDDNGIASGSVYLFRYSGSSWVQEQKLLASDGAAGDLFGSSVDISGDITLVGASCDGDYGSKSGSAYIFRYNGSSWVQERKLIASDGENSDRFGYSVAVKGLKALVGAFRKDDFGFDTGSAYVFDFKPKAIPKAMPWIQLLLLSE
jgi:hypothetical protein